MLSMACATASELYMRAQCSRSANCASSHSSLPPSACSTPCWSMHADCQFYNIAPWPEAMPVSLMALLCMCMQCPPHHSVPLSGPAPQGASHLMQSDIKNI